jgi:hypothetical protein
MIPQRMMEVVVLTTTEMAPRQLYSFILSMGYPAGQVNISTMLENSTGQKDHAACNDQDSDKASTINAVYWESST